MKTTKISRVIVLILAACLLGYAFWADGQKIPAGIVLLWMLLWGLNLDFAQGSASSVFFVVYAGACLLGSFLGLRPIFLLAGFIAALSAWDIDRFFSRWKNTETDFQIEKQHLLRLLAVDSVGFLLAAVGLTYRIQLSFVMMLLVGALALVSLIWLIGLLRNLGSKK
jgi:hypothetical protein